MTMHHVSEVALTTLLGQLADRTVERDQARDLAARLEAELAEITFETEDSLDWLCYRCGGYGYSLTGSQIGPRGREHVICPGVDS